MNEICAKQKRVQECWRGLHPTVDGEWLKMMIMIYNICVHVISIWGFRGFHPVGDDDMRT